MSIKQLVVTCLNRKDCKYMNTSTSLCLIKSTISTKKIKATSNGNSNVKNVNSKATLRVLISKRQRGD